jgi:hypothetical protein
VILSSKSCWTAAPKLLNSSLHLSLGSTSPSCLPLRVPSFKASSRPATTPKLLDSNIVSSNPLPRQLLQLLKGTAPAGQHTTCSSSCAPERDSTCWATLFHATCSSSKLLAQQSTSGQQAPRTAKQHGLYDFPQAGSKDKKKGESLLHKTPSRRKQKGRRKHSKKNVD